MLRYLAGVGSALALVAAGLFFFRSSAAPEPTLPAPPPAVVQDAATPDPQPSSVPRASDRTREEKRFDRYDKDRDDRITRDEYLASRRKAFAKLDTSGDGRLSFDEWAVRTTTKFAGADKDRSATLSRAEFATTAVVRKAKPKCVCPPAGGDED